MICMEIVSSMISYPCSIVPGGRPQGPPLRLKLLLDCSNKLPKASLVKGRWHEVPEGLSPYLRERNPSTAIAVPLPFTREALVGSSNKLHFAIVYGGMWASRPTINVIKHVIEEKLPKASLVKGRWPERPEGLSPPLCKGRLWLAVFIAIVPGKRKRAIPPADQALFLLSFQTGQRML